jgi:hypothetical protein
MVHADIGPVTGTCRDQTGIVIATNIHNELVLARTIHRNHIWLCHGDCMSTIHGKQVSDLRQYGIRYFPPNHESHDEFSSE